MMANSAFSVAGSSSGGGGGELIEVVNLASDAQIPFTDLSALFKKYEIRLYNVLSTAQGNNLYARTSTNNGVSYDSGASDYAYGNLIGLGGSQYNPHSNASNTISLTATETGYGLSQTAGETLQGSIWIWNPGGISFCQISTLLTMPAYFGGSTFMSNINGGGYRKSLAAVDAVEIYVNSGALASGTMELWAYE